MAITNKERVGRGLEQLHKGLEPVVVRELPLRLGETLRISEIEELWIAMFLAIYAGSLRARLPASSG